MSANTPVNIPVLLDRTVSAKGPPLDSTVWLREGKVALLCRVEVRTADRWLIAGKIAYYRTPSGRMLFRRRDVLAVADRMQTTNGRGEGE